MPFAFPQETLSQKTSDKVLSIEEVNALIPKMQDSVYRLLQMNAQVNRTIDRLKSADIMLNDSLTINTISGQDEETIDALSSLKVLLSAIQVEVNAINDHGGSIDSIEDAVIQWKSSINDHELTLSWKLGEKKVVFGMDNNHRKPLSDILNAQLA